ncbi:hypothetical protein Tco_0724088, partial [Tanacetum coccineum]
KDKEESSSDDDEMVNVKVFMALLMIKKLMLVKNMQGTENGLTSQ